ncbi:dihydropteroate synthase [Moraxella nasovis]|uniref:dihydropteroate synthase n=1 Tax=Moraxella nasovis TaxID=2904121 RepID=UPI001F6239FE|nr:dihydropteroate synthase [Moraxella nasovis]UNU72997.1 dihydropteroate synthase [Moraxella nasovis]
MTAIFNPLPAHKITHRTKVLDLSTPKVMGVLNVTPDSFSDGGRFNTLDYALKHAEHMLHLGVDIIDIGGESTRPNAAVISTDEELRRVIPVIQSIRKNFGDEIWLSIDTSNPTIMKHAIESGADIINDVRALRRPLAAQTAAKLNCPVVLMHSRGEPDTMNDLATYEDVLSELKTELQAAISCAVQAGIKKDHIIIDVGMGFAKNFSHHQIILKHIDEIIKHFNLPMLFGVSRKRFLGEILNKMNLAHLQNHAAIDRDGIGVLAHLLAIQQGASIVRVHDVGPMVQAVKFWQIMLENNK